MYDIYVQILRADGQATFVDIDPLHQARALADEITPGDIPR